VVKRLRSLLSLENLSVLGSFLERQEVSEGSGAINAVALGRVSCVISAGVEIEVRGVAEVFTACVAFCSA
jgi:hypothetical protein